MNKMLMTGAGASQALTAGINTVASCVRLTLGPKGRNVVLGPYVGKPKITNDGASIAKIISVCDPFANLGCEILKEVSEKTDTKVGDGTTTAIVLAQALIEEGLKCTAAGMNSTALSLSLQNGAELAVQYLRDKADKVSGLTEIARVATVSSADGAIGELIAQAFAGVGLNGIVKVEEAKTQDTRLEFVDGIRFNKGRFTPKVVSSYEKDTETLDDVLVLVTDMKISYIHEIFPILEVAVRTGKPLLIIAEDISIDLLALLLTNKKKGTMNVTAVQVPGYGERRQEYLQDIAVITGAAVITSETGIELAEATEEDLGHAQRIMVNHDTTTIIGGSGHKDAIRQRCREVRQAYEAQKPGWNKDKLRERLGWLQGGIALIKVGGATELEMSERKDRVDDAVRAVQAAIGGGIVAGGGTALLRAGAAIAQAKRPGAEAEAALRILQKALEAPLRQIAGNAGRSGETVIEAVRELPDNVGYDAAEDQYVDMLEAGIIDPVEVTCTAIMNAVSIAALVIDSGGLILSSSRYEQKY